MSKKHAKFKTPSIRAKPDLSPIPEQTIAISLQYLTKNKQYNFEYFGKDFRNKEFALESFFAFLKRLTEKTRLDIASLKKSDDCGFEEIPVSAIKINVAHTPWSEETKVVVFRFGSGDKDYRVLGFFDRNPPVFFVIGFDFDHTAYEHGN